MDPSAASVSGLSASAGYLALGAFAIAVIASALAYFVTRWRWSNRHKLACAERDAHLREVSRLSAELATHKHAAASPVPVRDDSTDGRLWTPANIGVVISAVAGLAALVHASQGLFKEVSGAWERNRSVNAKLIELETFAKAARETLLYDPTEWRMHTPDPIPEGPSSAKTPIGIDNKAIRGWKARTPFFQYEARRPAVVDLLDAPTSGVTLTIFVRRPARVLLQPITPASR